MPIVVSNTSLITAQRVPRFGMSEINGSLLTGAAHLVQSIKNILSTKKNQRVMLRHYGMTDRLDQRATRVAVQHVYSEITDNLAEFEPRFNLEQLSYSLDNRQPVFSFTGTDANGKTLEISTGGAQ